MGTRKEVVENILENLGDRKVFSARAMFGEYALYCKGNVVALICDDMLYVKMLPASVELKRVCETGEPYPGAKPHYIVDERQIAEFDSLPGILKAIASALPARPAKKKK